MYHILTELTELSELTESITAADAEDVAATQQSISEVWNRISGLSLMGVAKIIILIIVLLILIRLLGGLLDRMLEKSRMDRTAHGFIKAAAKVIMYFLAVMIVAGSLGINTSSLIAVLSVAGLALSLALQGALSNLAGGIVLLVTRPFSVGDYVSIGDKEGFVKEINMTYTQLCTFQHQYVSIPNSNVTSQDVVNYSTEGKRRVDITVTASYDADLDTVKTALRDAVRQVPQMLPGEEITAFVSGYKDNGIEYTVRGWCRNEDYWNAWFGLMEQIKRSFDANGVEMTYTNLVLHLADRAEAPKTEDGAGRPERPESPGKPEKPEKAKKRKS